jgi:hypothetical protein
MREIVFGLAALTIVAAASSTMAEGTAPRALPGGESLAQSVGASDSASIDKVVFVRRWGPGFRRGVVVLHMGSTILYWAAESSSTNTCGKGRAVRRHIVSEVVASASQGATSVLRASTRYELDAYGLAPLARRSI